VVGGGGLEDLEVADRLLFKVSPVDVDVLLLLLLGDRGLEGLGLLLLSAVEHQKEGRKGLHVGLLGLGILVVEEGGEEVDDEVVVGCRGDELVSLEALGEEEVLEESHWSLDSFQERGVDDEVLDVVVEVEEVKDMLHVVVEVHRVLASAARDSVEQGDSRDDMKESRRGEVDWDVGVEEVCGLLADGIVL